MRLSNIHEAIIKMVVMTHVTSTPPTHTLLRISHALLDYLGAEVDVRVLHIKGVAIDPTLAEGRHGSTDCDVVIHPSNIDTYTRCLEANGWELRTTFEHGSVFNHAATYYHPVWGTVDVHRAFPGLDADPAYTFESWWHHSHTVELGGRTIHVLSLLDQRVLLLMHAARSSRSRKGHDYNVVWECATPAERAEVEARAVELGGKTPLMLVTSCEGQSRWESVRGSKDFHLWSAMSRDANPTEVWVAQLQDAPKWSDKVRVMWSAMHINRDHLAVHLDRTPTRSEMRRAWIERLGRGTRRVLKMICSGRGLRSE